MDRLTLNGSWQLTEANSAEIISAVVPGTQYSDLLRAGKIPDPFDKTNEKATHWVGERDWVYTRSFDVSAELLSYGKQELCFDMLDTVATVELNGAVVLNAQNAHLKYCVSVKGQLKESDNLLKVTFRSPVKYVEEKNAADKMPTNMNGVSGVPHIRKPQCHFGWDWGPIIPVAGIVKDCYLAFYPASKISYLDVRQKVSDNIAYITVKAEIAGTADRVDYTLTHPSGATEAVTAAAGATHTFTVVAPELWYTADLSGKTTQPLYRVTAVLKNGEAAEDVAEKKIGVRTLVLDRNKDESGTQFRFILNGLPMFAKGANWIPADSFPDRVDKEVYRYYIDAMLKAHQNIVRVWGGGYYADDEFYDLCDEKGILVWQDFCFACAPYPFYNDDFLQNVKEEVFYQVRRLRHRASLALWCGNNEIEAMTPGWMLMKKLIDWSKKFFWEILPVWLNELENVTPFVEGSPIGTGFLKDVGADAHGDTHMWQVWHGLKPLTYYRTRKTRFCSEFGLESLPDMRTIRSFAEEKDYSLSSEVFMAHQKCMSGNNKMLYYIATKFRIPKKFEDIVYYTQIIQTECVRDATEHFRRHRGQSNGAIYWQLNDCWPVSSWSSIDYRGRYKVLQYRQNEFNAPVTLSLEEGKNSAKIYLFNDTYIPFSGEARYRLLTLDGKEIVQGRIKAQAEAVSSVYLTELNVKKFRKKYRNKIVLEVALFDADKNFVNRRLTLFAPEKNIRLPDPKLRFAAAEQSGTVTISIKAEQFARFVKIDSPYGHIPYSDYAFDLLAGETKTVTVPLPASVSAEEYVASLSVSSVYDVAPKGGRLSDFLLRLKIHLIPINIANWIYYSFT